MTTGARCLSDVHVADTTRTLFPVHERMRETPRSNKLPTPLVDPVRNIPCGMSRRGEFQFGPSSDAPWKETIATVNPQGHVSHKRHGIEERHPSGVRESSRSAATTPPITRVVVRKLGNGWVTKVYDSEGHLRSGISAPSSLDYVKRKSEEWFPGVPVEYEEPAVPSTGKYRQGR